MAIEKIEHLGVAVADLKEASKVFDTLLAKQQYKVETVEREKVSTAFYQLGQSKIELLESTDPEGTISKYVEKRGQGIHHLALAVDDIHAEMKRLKDAGFRFLYEEPLKGADNKLITFIHPKSCCGILVELCMDDPDA